MKHIYTKMLCVLALGMASAMSASADKGVVVISTDGTERYVTLADIDRIQIGQNSLTVQCVNGTSQTVPYKDIDRVLVGASTSSVSSITAPGEIAVWPTATTDIVNISGLAAGETVAVFDIKGATVLKGISAEGLTTLSLGHLPAGIYVLAVNGKSVKIIKN